MRAWTPNHTNDHVVSRGDTGAGSLGDPWVPPAIRKAIFMTFLEQLMPLIMVFGLTVGYLWIVVRAGDPDDPLRILCLLMCLALLPIAGIAYLILELLPGLRHHIQESVYREREERERDRYR